MLPNHLVSINNKIEKLWLKGIDFSVEEIKFAQKENKMLLLDIDFTDECKLFCYYCDRTPDRYSKNERGESLTTDCRKEIILQAKELGVRTVEFPGAGEPMLDKGFWDILEFNCSHGLTSVIFTSGYHLTNEAIEKLYDLDASIVLKYNSKRPDVQDKIVGKAGYGEKINGIVGTIIRKGFNKTLPTRFGIDVVITQKNNDLDEIKEIFRWARLNNIHPYISTLIPEGLSDKKSKVMDRTKATNIINEICQIDKDEFMLEYEPALPFAGGYRCRQVNIGLFVNLHGQVYDCNGLGRFLGHIKTNRLKEIWNSAYSRYLRKDIQDGFCIVRERFWNGIEIHGMERKLRGYKEWEASNGMDMPIVQGLEVI